MIKDHQYRSENVVLIPLNTTTDDSNTNRSNMSIPYNKGIIDSEPSPSLVHLDAPRQVSSMDVEEDLFQFPAHVRVDYDGVVKEPDYFPDNRIAQIFKPVSLCLKSWYDSIHFITYYVLSLLLGAILSVVWGLCFGCVNFSTVWLFQPFIKLWFTALRCTYIIFRPTVRMFCDPCYQSLGLMFSKINGKFTVNVNGLERIQNI